MFGGGRMVFAALHAGGWLLVVVLALFFLRPVFMRMARGKAPPLLRQDEPDGPVEPPPPTTPEHRRQARAYLRSLKDGDESA